MDKVQNNILHPHITPLTKNVKQNFSSKWLDYVQCPAIVLVVTHLQILLTEWVKYSILIAW